MTLPRQVARELGPSREKFKRRLSPVPEHLPPARDTPPLPRGRVGIYASSEALWSPLALNTGQQNRPWADPLLEIFKGLCLLETLPGMQYPRPLQPQACPSLPPSNAFLTFPTHLPGSGGDSQLIDIWHLSLRCFFWLKWADLAGEHGHFTGIF